MPMTLRFYTGVIFFMLAIVLFINETTDFGLSQWIFGGLAGLVLGAISVLLLKRGG